MQLRWNTAARIIHKRGVEEVTRWKAAGSVGLKLGDMPPGLTKAEQMQWAIREDEAWNERVVAEVRAILESRGHDMDDGMDIAI